MFFDGHLTRLELDGTVEHRDGQQFINGKGFSGDGFERAHRPEPHGFASWPVKGGIGVAVQARGARDSAYVLGGENPSLRPTLTQGGTAIYDHLGNIVSIVQAKLRIAHATAIEIVGPVTIVGNVQVQGNINASGSIIDSGGNTNHHGH